MKRQKIVEGNFDCKLLKKRFFKKILPGLNSFGLTDAEKKQLRGERRESVNYLTSNKRTKILSIIHIS